MDTIWFIPVNGGQGYLRLSFVEPPTEEVCGETPTSDEYARVADTDSPSPAWSERLWVW